jgi:polysaccharide pyruvyl transferase WcaK-like protein
MKKITLFDTSICSENIGDFIIMEAVKTEVSMLFTDDMIFQSLTHDKISKSTYQLNKISDFTFIGGTNLLSSNMNSYNQWKINLIDGFFLKNIILLGVGWWQYQDNPNLYTQLLLKKVLHSEILHSVRDSYTEKMLRKMGFKNVINTGCPTMWTLTKKHCQTIPIEKSDNVVFTLTDYNRDIVRDQKLINILSKKYNKLYFWPQGSEDLQYFNSFSGIHSITILGGNLNAYNTLLESKKSSLDYVGTRLHAGIRALQKQRRTIIIGIDNRSYEKSRDFNLKVFPREKIDELDKIIDVNFSTNIIINEDNINVWKGQFI